VTEPGRSSAARAGDLGSPDVGSTPTAPTKRAESGSPGAAGPRGSAAALRAPRAACADGHPADRVEWRRKRSMGRTRFVRQCGACGRQVGSPVGPERVPDPRNVPLFDHRAAKKREPNSKRRAYEKFLKSPRWKRLRDQVLERDGYACKASRNGEMCGEAATEVAHRNYDKPLEEVTARDLYACCGTCNLDEREKRITRFVLGG
jgi:hypothetical protein